MWNPLVDDMESLLEAHSVDIESRAIKLSTMLEVDVDTEQFVGDRAEAANSFLKREYRAPFVVPELVS